MKKIWKNHDCYLAAIPIVIHTAHNISLIITNAIPHHFDVRKWTPLLKYC